MISLKERITAITQVRYSDTKDLIKGIKNKRGY